MKILILSDLHHEIWGHQTRMGGTPWLEDYREIGRDLTILAGDICGKSQLLDVFKVFAPYSQVLYIPGNHEYYHQNYEDVNDAIHKAKSGLDVKAGTQVSFVRDGKRFIACTLWTGFNNFNNDVQVTAYRYINDFRLMKVSDKVIQPLVMKGLHDADVAFIERELKAAKDAGQEAIVVTHFVPTMRFIQEKWKKDKTTLLLNHYFANQLDYIMEGEYAPKLWVCGHTHDEFDGVVGKTRVVCRPKGYPRENYSTSYGYKPLVVEV